MSEIQIPIVNAGELYINGLVPYYIDATHLGVTPGQTRNSTDVNDIEIPDGAILNTALVGVINGVQAAISSYQAFWTLYAVGDSSKYNPSGVFAVPASATSISLPFGYDMIRYIGDFFIDGSNSIVNFSVVGNGNYRTLWYADERGGVTNQHATTFTNLSLAGTLPPCRDNEPKTAIINVNFTPNSAGNTMYFSPLSASPSDTQCYFSSPVAGVVDKRQVQVPVGIATDNLNNCWIDYKSTSMSDNITFAIIGYTFSI